MNGLEQLLVSNVGAVTVTGGFLWYLSLKTKIDRQTSSEFTRVLQSHLKQANKVIKDNTNAAIKNSMVLQELEDCIHALNSKRKK